MLYRTDHILRRSTFPASMCTTYNKKPIQQIEITLCARSLIGGPTMRSRRVSHTCWYQGVVVT